MHSLIIWLIIYCLPALVAGGISRYYIQYHRRILVFIHILLVVSAGASLYIIDISGLTFPWHVDILPVVSYAATVLFAVVLLGRLGIFYGVSALIQEFTMLSSAFILLQYFPVYVAILMIAPLFIFCHRPIPS